MLPVLSWLLAMLAAAAGPGGITPHRFRQLWADDVATLHCCGSTTCPRVHSRPSVGVLLLDEKSSQPTPALSLPDAEKVRAESSFPLHCLSVARPAECGLSKMRDFCVRVCALCTPSSLFPLKTPNLVS